MDTKTILEVMIEKELGDSFSFFPTGRGPRIFRGRGGPMIGGPMVPFPGPMGPPFGE